MKKNDGLKRGQGRSIDTPFFLFQILTMDTIMTCSDPFTMEKLLFWTLGYGGWLGIALLPVFWSLPNASVSIKVVTSILIPPVIAIVVTGLFYILYGFAYITNKMTSVMLSPLFLQSCIGMVCVSFASVGLYIAHYNESKVPSSASDASDSDASASDSDESSDSSEESEETVEDAESTDIDTEVEEVAEEPEPLNVNTDILRNAPPLSE
jgi:hypothetical protein